MSLTYIPGKDEALEASIARLSQAISTLGFHIEEARWLNPVPYIWSVYLRDRDCPQIFSHGKGASRDAALASAYGALIERLSTRYFWADFYLAPVRTRFGFVHQHDEQWFALDEAQTALLPSNMLDAPARAVIDPEQQLRLAQILDANGGDALNGVCTLPYQRASDGATVQIPVNVIGNLFVSNGMSAGNNRDEALVQGLSEIFERAIKKRIIAQAITLPEVPEYVMARYPEIQAGMTALENAGFTLRALDASLGGRYPVMCVLLQNPTDGGVYAAFGAHPRFGVALERALTELLQGRALEALEGFPTPTTNMDLVSDPHNLTLHCIDASGYVSWALLSNRPDIDFSDWNDDRDNATTRQALIDLLTEEGFETYIAEHTGLGAYACRILVPGFSEIYPVDELRWHNNNQAIEHRDTLFDLVNAGQARWQALLETLDSNGVNEQLRVLEWAGIVGDRDTPWARLRIGELKLWLLLALNALAKAEEQIATVLALSHLSQDEGNSLRALGDVLSLYNAGADIDDYRRALCAYHGESQVETAEELCEGRQLFPGLHALDSMCPTRAHGRLLEAYARVLSDQTQPA